MFEIWIYTIDSNKGVFFSLEFVNILFQMEAKPVKMCLHFFNSVVKANSKLDYWVGNNDIILCLNYYFLFRYTAPFHHEGSENPMLFLEDGSVLKSTLLGALECKLARPTV